MTTDKPAQRSSVASAARDLFDVSDGSAEAKGCLAGAPLLTDEDESTKVPGVFLVGPSVVHGELSFCADPPRIEPAACGGDAARVLFCGRAAAVLLLLRPRV